MCSMSDELFRLSRLVLWCDGKRGVTIGTRRPGIVVHVYLLSFSSLSFISFALISAASFSLAADSSVALASMVAHNDVRMRFGEAIHKPTVGARNMCFRSSRGFLTNTRDIRLKWFMERKPRRRGKEKGRSGDGLPSRVALYLFCSEHRAAAAAKSHCPPGVRIKSTLSWKFKVGAKSFGTL